MLYLTGLILNYRFSVRTYYFYYYYYYIYLYTRDLLVFAISSVATHCELDLWT